MRKSYKRSFDEIARIVADTAQFFAEHEINDELRMKVDLSLEELFVNMVNYNTETDREILRRLVVDFETDHRHLPGLHDRRRLFIETGAQDVAAALEPARAEPMTDRA